MAVPSQGTVAVGDKITASLWNDDVRDAVNFLISPTIRATTNVIAPATLSLVNTTPATNGEPAANAPTTLIMIVASPLLFMVYEAIQLADNDECDSLTPARFNAPPLFCQTKTLM